MKKLFAYTKKYYIPMMAATASSIGASAATVLIIDFLRRTIDAVILEDGRLQIMMILFQMAVIIFLGMFCNYMVTAMTGAVGRELLKDLRNDSLKSIMRASPDFVSNQNFGDLMERLSSDMEELAGFMQGYFKDCLSVPVLVIVYSVYLISVNPSLALVCLFPLAILVPFNIKRMKPVKLRQFQLVKELGYTNNYIQEGVDGAEVIKSYNLQSRMEDRYYHALKKTFDISNDTDLRQYHIEPVSRAIHEIPMALALCLGGYLVFTGNITIGILIAYISTINKLIEPLSLAYQLVVRSQTAMVTIERVFYIIDIPPEETKTNTNTNTGNTHIVVEFKNVSFRYDVDDANVIDNISFSLKKGTKTALVGRSGGGKSTVLKLITRQLECSQGNILYCGMDYQDSSPGEVRSQMALISQDTVIFPMSVKDNIRIGNPHASEEEIKEAARLAKCAGFIRELPKGMDTVLQEKGNNLSGGQRQRLALARAIVKNAPVLLLDEPTSALDKDAEEFICQTISEISEDKTVINVAHRLSTVKDYDMIFVVDGGKIAERGNHEELMKKRGIYFEMYEEYEMAGGCQE